MRWSRESRTRVVPQARRLLLLLGTRAFFGCSEAPLTPIARAHSDDVARQGGTLHLASFSDIRTLDPAMSTDALSRDALLLMFDGLVDFGDNGEIVPSLAERFESSADGLVTTFLLKPGVIFHDGEELTASDVKRSIERALHPATGNPAASLYAGIAGFDDLVEKRAPELRGVRVLGRYALSIEITEPDATFLARMALPTIRPVCRSASESSRDGFIPCGTGPFKLEAGGWRRGRSLRLVRHERYHRPGLPHLDAVEFSYTTNFALQRFKFRRGDLDIMRDFLTPDLMQVENDPRWKAYGAFDARGQLAGESMNTELPPFDNLEVRRAVASAIQRDHIRLVKPGALSVATSPLEPTDVGYDPNYPGQTYNVAEALEHMAKAGYPFDPVTQRGGYPKVIPYPVYKQGITELTAQLLAQDLAKIGIRIDIVVMSYPTWLHVTHERGRTLLAPGAWATDFPDSASVLEPFSAQSITSDDSLNASFYKNPAFDALLTEGRRTRDRERRSEIYAKANRLVCEEAPAAFTYAYHFFTAWHPFVRGFKPHPVWNERVSDVWLDRTPDRWSRLTELP